MGGIPGKSKRSIIPVNTQPTAKVLQLHHALQKVESSILVQMRTHCIGLKKFLYECRVPNIDSPMCDCGGGKETAEHIAMLCPLESSRKHLLFDDYGSQQPWKTLIGTPIQAKRLNKWFIKSERIGQFFLAKKLLYQTNLHEN